MSETSLLSDTPEGEDQTPPIEIYLDPLQLLIAVEAGFARDAPGTDFESTLPRGYIVFREFSPALELRGLDFWTRFGESVLVTKDGRRYLVQVATFLDVHHVFLNEYVQLSAQSMERLRSFLVRMEAYLGVSASPNRRRDVLMRYHELKPADQAEGVALLRANFARGKLANSFADHCTVHFAELLRAHPQDAHWAQWREQMQEGSKAKAEFARNSPLVIRALEQYYWEGAACPAPGHPGVLRYLPPSRSERPGEEDGPPIEPPIEPPPVAVEEEDVRVIPPAEAGKRFEFYQRIFGCKVVVRPRKLFGKEEHNYFGYLVKTRKGTWLLIIDCDKYGCAAYICQINPNDPLRYIRDVQKPRYELLRIKAARTEAEPPEDKAPTFVGREVHDETVGERMERRWQED